MKKKSIIGLIIVLMLSVFMISGCEVTASVDEQNKQQQEKMLQQANNELGMPNITNYYEKKVLKQVMEACDDSKLITYAYSKNEYTGKFTYLGQAMGYGVPYGTEYTNPEKMVYQSFTIPQADPNGLFKATDVNATWVMLIDPATKKAQPMYFESDLTVLPFKLPKNLVEPFSIPANY